MITLSGEADLVSAAELSALIAGQLADGTQELTIDASGLRFADTSAIRALILAARTLNERDGRLVLLHPQANRDQDLGDPGHGGDVHDRWGDPGRARGRRQREIIMPSTVSQELPGLGAGTFTALAGYWSASNHRLAGENC